MARYGGLVEDDVALWIDAGCEKCRGDGARLAFQVLMDELCRDRMQVDDAIDAVVAVLQRDEALDGAEIVAEMEVAVG